ncbi:centrosome assembly protein spindle defective 2 isoform X2 [Tachypleus tridentatus]|uniref:centrosome assembly protein spindle defective 2 isoform X2 n=1 Tax=Tachypleus tridentatus TaxID=6853 RepID=UPI003FD39B76
MAGIGSKLSSKNDFLDNTSLSSLPQSPQAASTAIRECSKAGLEGFLKTQNLSGVLKELFPTLDTSDAFSSLLNSIRTKHENDKIEGITKLLADEHETLDSNTMNYSKDSGGTFDSGEDHSSLGILSLDSLQDMSGSLIKFENMAKVSSSDVTASSSDTKLNSLATITNDTHKGVSSNNHGGIGVGQDRSNHEKQATPVSNSVCTETQESSEVENEGSLENIELDNVDLQSLDAKFSDFMELEEEDVFKTKDAEYQHQEEKIPRESKLVSSKNLEITRWLEMQQKMDSTNSNNSTNKTAEMLIIERRKRNSNESEQETEDNVKNGSGFSVSGSTRKMETAALYASNSGLSEKSERKKAAHDFFPKNDCEVLVNDAGANGLSKNSTCRTFITSCVQQNLPEQVDCHSSIGQEFSKTMRHSDIKNSSLLKDYESLQLYKSALTNNQASGLLYSQLFIPAKPLIAAEDESNIKNSTSLGISPLEMDASSFTVEEIYRNLKSSAVKDKNETKSSEVEFRTDQISARSSSFGSYQTHKIDGSNAESSSACTSSNLKSQDVQLDSRISKSNFQQQQTNKYFEINPANCNSVKDFDVGNLFLARSSFGDFGSSSTPSNVKTDPASKLQTEDSEKRVNSFPSEDECAEPLTTDINVQDASVNHFSCTDMDISKQQQEQLGDLGISDEVFLKPDEALNLLNKDEEDFKKEHIFEGETIPDTYAVSLMSSNLTLAALHDISRPSWYSEVDSGKSSSRVSIGQFIGAKTEELGYLNGSELGVRPEFGINKKKIDSTTDQLTISENKGSSARLAWNSVIPKGIFRGSSEDSALGRTSSCTVLSDSTQDSSDSTMFSCSSISKLLSDASLSEDPFVFASKVLEKSKARAVTKKKVKDRNKTPNNGLPTIREDTPVGEHKKTLNEPSSKGVYDQLPEVLSLNTYSANEIKQHRFSLQKAINKTQNIESTFQKKHEDKSDDSLLNKICKFGVEHDLTLKGNINSHLFAPEIMKDQQKDLKEWQKFKRQKESTLSTTSDKNGEDSHTLKPNSFVNEVLGNTKDTSTSDVTVVTTDAIITRYKAKDENSITSVSTTISSNTNTSTCYGQQVLSSFDNTVRLPLPTALQLPIVQLVDSNKVNNSTNTQSATQLSQGTSINPSTVPVSINVHCKVDPQPTFYPSSYTTNYPLPGLQTLGVPTSFHPSVPPTIDNWSKFHQGVDLNTPFGMTVGTPFFPGSTQSVMISPYSTVPSLIYQASNKQCSVVQAPSEISYPGIVCVGDTAPIKIPLHNPTQCNVLYAFKTESVTVDGLTVNDFHGSFLSLPQHVEIECGMTREIEINYTPRQPGTLCAKIMVSASVHFREMTAASSFHSFGCPLYINVTVKSEKPKIDLFFGDVGNVRHVPENCSLSKSLVVKNQGLSFIPVRLIISGDMKSKHDFCFDVQNLETKEKSTQLVSPTILLCRLPCASELVVPLVFNAGFLDDGNLVENISASVTAMLESTVIPEVLGYLKWSAVIGKVRLITKTPSEGHIPAKCSGARIKHSLPLYNKGTIPVELVLRVKDNSAFQVSPVKCYLEPEDDTTLRITFEPSFSRGPVTGMIQAIAQPFGQVFDIYKILSNGLVQDFSNQAIKIPPATGISKRSSSAQMNSDNQGFPLQSNKKFLAWPGVPVGTSVIKQMTLRNGSSADSLYLCMNIKGDSQQFQLEEEEVGDHTSNEIAISPGGIHIVKVKYTPKAVEAAFSCLSIHLKGQNHEGQGKFNIPLQGYGGTNKLELEGLQPDECGDSFSLNVGELAESDATLAHFVVTNAGTRAAYIKIMNFTGPSLESILPAGRITVQPSEFVLLEQESKTLFIACTLSDFKWKMHVNQKNQRLGTLSIFYGDEILRQMMRRAISTVNIAKILPPGNPLRSVNFDVLYAGEDRDIQTINYPSTSRNVYIFYNNINKVSVNLYGILTSDSSFYGSMSSFAALTALHDTVNSTVTDSIYHQTQQHANILQSPPVKETQKLQYLNQEGNKRPTTPLLEHPKEIKLFETVVNTSSSYSFELKSQCNKKVKWRLCPVAVPVIEDLSGEKTVNQVQPLPSSVFCVTPDSGEIEPYQFVSVKLVFSPAEAGLYKQLWEIIMETMDQARQSEHLKMEGKGIDNPQSIVVHNKLTSHSSLYIPKSNHMDISSHDVYLSKPSNRSASAGDSIEENSRQPVFPVTSKINFPVTQIGGSATVKLMLKNVSTENHKLSVVIPIPPFLVKHNELTIKNRHYISLPVQFKPTKQGKYQSVLVLHTDMGYDISVQISGEAS